MLASPPSARALAPRTAKPCSLKSTRARTAASGGSIGIRCRSLPGSSSVPRTVLAIESVSGMRSASRSSAGPAATVCASAPPIQPPTGESLT